MDATTFRSALVDARADELRELGSAELLAVLTEGELDGQAVLQAAAHSEHAAYGTFRRWADDESDPALRSAFVAVAAQEEQHRQRVLDALGDPGIELVDGGPMHAYLRGRSEGIDRIAGGMVARALVVGRTHERIRSFFRDRDDRERARLFADLERETDGVLKDGLSLLEERCASAADWERARAVAEYTIRVAYDDYADALRARGRDPDAT